MPSNLITNHAFTTRKLRYGGDNRCDFSWGSGAERERCGNAEDRHAYSKRASIQDHGFTPGRDRHCDYTWYTHGSGIERERCGAPSISHAYAAPPTARPASYTENYDFVDGILTYEPVDLEQQAEARRLAIADLQESEAHQLGWVLENGVRCVVAPCCGFTFDADHTDVDGDRYSCPLCSTSQTEDSQTSDSTEPDSTEPFSQAIEDEAKRIIDNIAPIEWDVHVWTDGPTRGRLDRADSLRLVQRVLSISKFDKIAHQKETDHD